MTEELHMVQLRFLGRALGRLRRGSTPAHWQDDGYKLHCVLGELFGHAAPGPFVLEEADERGITVLAYSVHALSALQETAQLEAAPNIYAACDWEASASKPMPTGFRVSARLGFEVRVCPVVRLGKNTEGLHPEEAGSELDVFVHSGRHKLREALAAGHVTPAQLEDPFWEPSQNPSCALDRGEVYVRWLKERLETQGGARVVEASMTHFLLHEQRRRTHEEGRAARKMIRPEATIKGILEVVDPALFLALIKRGVGRHTAFGFGMLKLKRAPKGA